MGFMYLPMLFGLAAIAIPILIHLLHRRRFDVVDWGAMQFLQISQTTRRRLFIEEILLLLVRVGLVVLIVMALARPFADASWLGFGGSSARLVILLFDGSYSMAFDNGSGTTPLVLAKRKANELLDTLRPGDEAALIVAGAQPVVVLEPTRDVQRVRAAIADLAAPAGGCDWPRAVQAARMIAPSVESPGSAEVVLFRDNQRFGWADDETLARWKLLKASVKADAERIAVIESEPTANVKPALNYALAPLQAGRAIAWAGQTVRFRTALMVDEMGAAKQSKPERVPRVYFEVDGQFVADFAVPDALMLEQAPLTFTHRFDQAGTHKVAVVVEQRDPLSGDNRQEIEVDVVANFPVLLVDGDRELSASSSSYFLHKALTLSPDPKRSAVVDARVVTLSGFAVGLLDDAKTKPQVLILADVPHLTASQEQAVERFVRAGGGLLVVAGSRVEGTAKEYNRTLYLDGKGWLPARLDQVLGDIARPDQAVFPDGNRSAHAAFAVFRTQAGALAGARFPRWWKVSVPEPPADTPAMNRAVAYFNNGDPFLVEGKYGAGKVLLCTAPLDRTWSANFPSVWEYPIFVQEVVAYLAKARRTELTPTDSRESDLTPLTAAERAAVAEHIPLSYCHNGTPTPTSLRSRQRQDIWWLLLIGVSMFLCLELWLTRRMTRQA